MNQQQLRRERALTWLENNPGSTAQQLADAVYCVLRHAQYLLRKLHEEQPPRAHVSGWLKSYGEGSRGRYPTRLWSAGDGIDMPRPERDSASLIRKRRKSRLIETHGAEIASKILRPRKRKGSSVIQIEGELVYRRGMPRGTVGGLSAEYRMRGGV